MVGRKAILVLEDGRKINTVKSKRKMKLYKEETKFK